MRVGMAQQHLADLLAVIRTADPDDALAVELEQAGGKFGLQLRDLLDVRMPAVQVRVDGGVGVRAIAAAFLGDVAGDIGAGEGIV
jgi:hypothetical protein